MMTRKRKVKNHNGADALHLFETNGSQTKNVSRCQKRKGGAGQDLHVVPALVKKRLTNNKLQIHPSLKNMSLLQDEQQWRVRSRVYPLKPGAVIEMKDVEAWVPVTGMEEDRPDGLEEPIGKDTMMHPGAVVSMMDLGKLDLKIMHGEEEDMMTVSDVVGVVSMMVRDEGTTKVPDVVEDMRMVQGEVGVLMMIAGVVALQTVSVEVSQILKIKQNVQSLAKAAEGVWPIFKNNGGNDAAASPTKLQV